MGIAPANDIQVLVFDEFSGDRLIGNRFSLILDAYKLQYTWTSTYCPDGYVALGNALFVKALPGLWGQPETPPPHIMNCVLHPSPNGVARWTYRPGGDAQFGGASPVLCVLVFPHGCGADDFNFMHFGVKDVDGRLAVIFLLPHREEIKLRWRIYRTDLPLSHQIEKLTAASDAREEQTPDSLVRLEGRNPKISNEIETLLL